MKTIYSWQPKNFPPPEESLLESLLEKTAELCGLELDAADIVSLAFVDGETIADINVNFVGHEGVTDVISFDYRDEGVSPELAEACIELIICVDKAASEGEDREDSSYEYEMALYIVHGMLHASGEDDLEPEPRKRMRLREKEVLGELLKEFDFREIFPSLN